MLEAWLLALLLGVHQQMTPLIYEDKRVYSDDTPFYRDTHMKVAQLLSICTMSSLLHSTTYYKEQYKKCVWLQDP